MRSQNGVTLIEVMIVLVMLGILALLLTPAMQTYFAQGRLESAAESLYGDIHLARSTAIKQSTAVNLVFQTGTTWCYGITTAANCNCNTGTCNLNNVNSNDFPGTILSITSGFAGNTTQFDAVRAAASNTGSVTLTASTGESVIVSINGLGMPKVCSSTVRGYSAC